MNNPLINNYQNNFNTQFWQDLNLENESNIQILELINFVSTLIIDDLYLIFITLKKYNYIFENSESAFCFSRIPINNNIQYLNDYFIHQGKIPMLFSAIYEKVGSINFIGCFQNSSFDILLDPFVLFSIHDIIECNNIEFDLLKYSSQNVPYIGFSPNELAKESISGSGYFYGIELQQIKTIDSLLINYDDDENLFFIEYLRKVIWYGGFPNLEFLNFDDLDLNTQRYLNEIRNNLKTKF